MGTDEIKKDNKKRQTIVSRASDETRIYDVLNKNTRIVSDHKWIDSDDEPVIRPIGVDSRTRVMQKSAEEAAAEAPKDGGGRSADLKQVPGRAAGFIRESAGALRSVRVADRGRFTRFLRIIGVFVLILLLEIGYLRFASHVEKMPAEIRSAQKELELTEKEIKLLDEDIEALGDYDSIEKQKGSWERLKEEVENAAAETSY